MFEVSFKIRNDRFKIFDKWTDIAYILMIVKRLPLKKTRIILTQKRRKS